MAVPSTPPRQNTFPVSDWSVLAAHWHPIAIAGEVNSQPIAARLLDQDLVIYRTSQGVTVAADVCAHRGAPLSMGRLKNDTLVCAYHGYCYDGTGRCTAIPAHPDSPIPGKLQLHVFPSVERHGLIWTSFDHEPRTAIPEFPEYADPAFQKILVPPLDWAASAGRQLESFCDVAHFAFVHEKTFAVRDPVVPRYEARATPTGVFAEFISHAGNVSDPNAAAQTWRRVYNIHLPFTAHLVIHFPTGGKLAMLNASCPVSARRTRVFPVVARDFDHDQPVADLIAFQQQIYAEDQAIVERQNPEDLPIDLTEEVHVRADLTSITYRRQLAALGLGRGFTS
ncbi:MAG TPA: aromatic ring-hydroxylating dioxygenase subunit alpha [Candidatus Didemnitutus sp.]|nr:aromatic ring-hydroxylating dioxygenase subunit alpha [Candidatus Didemnitutus sp.]